MTIKITLNVISVSCKVFYIQVGEQRAALTGHACMGSQRSSPGRCFGDEGAGGVGVLSPAGGTILSASGTLLFN